MSVGAFSSLGLTLLSILRGAIRLTDTAANPCKRKGAA